MFFSNLLILGGGMLVATMTGVEARAIGKLSFLPHRPFSTTPTSGASTLATLPPQETCAFTPHVPLRTTQSAFSIPVSAWPLLRTLLTTHIIPQGASSPPSSHSSTDAQVSADTVKAAVPPQQAQQPQQQKLILHNSVQTLHLQDFSDDASLEGLVLGLVFSTGEQDASYKELRSLKSSVSENKSEMEIKRRGLVDGEGEKERRSCIEEAVRKVEEGKVMEGVLELDARGGTVGFLIYRVD